MFVNNNFVLILVFLYVEFAAINNNGQSNKNNYTFTITSVWWVRIFFEYSL